MSQAPIDPFRAPEANLELGALAAEESRFFTASSLKLVLMSIATFGIYELYWFYRNWVAIKKRTGADKIMPFWRAFFSVIWAYPCFREIASVAFAGQIDLHGGAAGLAILYFLMSIAARAPDPYWLVTLLGFVPVLAVNGWARKANLAADPECPENSSLSGWNWAALIFGFAFLVLVLTGLFIPLEE
jgi:hypothetical protein